MAIIDKTASQIIPRASTFVDPQASRTVMGSTTPGDPNAVDPLNKEEWIDPLDISVNRPFNVAQRVAVYPYQGEPITTVSYNATAYSTNWWIILQFNGYLHQDEIPQGAMLDIPSFALIKSLAKGITANVQKTVVF